MILWNSKDYSVPCDNIIEVYNVLLYFINENRISIKEINCENGLILLIETKNLWL